MQLDEVTLDDGTDVIVGTALTDLTGGYMFRGLFPGTYTLGGSTTKAMGGLSMNDVQLARQYVTGQPPGNALAGIHLLAGDVDQTGTVNMNDVQFMRQQFTSQTPGYTMFWIFENPSVTIGPSATQDFQAIVAGDTDGSYVPPGAPAGAVCGNAIPIAYSGGTASVVNQTNCGLFDFYSGTCMTPYDLGEDILYMLTVTGGPWIVDITLDPKGTTYSGFLVADGCPDVGTCLAFSTNTGGTAHKIEALSLAAGTYYIMVDTWPSPDCIPDFDLTIEEWVPGYCDASTTIQDECIGDVICGTINNLATGWQGGVADYTALSTSIAAGASEPITVNSGCNIWASDLVEVWVDWNNDFTFGVGTNEEFILINDGTGTTFTGAIAVPAGTATGDYRMRVRMSYFSSYSPCGVGSYGEVEDYTISVP
jgi:hypothetical protein